MCTVVILRRPDHAWPLILAANRDEMIDRPWLPPGRHWSDRPEVIAGQDTLAGGTWLGMNDYGLIAAILNRKSSLGPKHGYRSRGEIPLEALDHAEAELAAEALGRIETASYRSFNAFIADVRNAYWLCSRAGEAGVPGSASVVVTPIPTGLSMLTAHDLNDLGSPRIRRHRPAFQAAPPPDPDRGDWSAWETLMASRDGGTDSDREAAMTIVGDRFGTVSSSILALPAPGRIGVKPGWRFCAGRPGEAPFLPVEFG
ncbi:MAG: hypothetical protein EXQ90_08515 [Rhodospirillales bacterium]|nr:hypothetical protein [Rhodospirillales bacterium]